MLIRNANVFYEGKLRPFFDVLVEGDKITGVGSGFSSRGDFVIDATGMYLLPGLIDIHTHGYGGNDVMGGEMAVRAIAEALPKHGVTSFLPTTMCDSIESSRFAVDGIAKAMIYGQGSTILGAHMEGPFINGKRKGAQPEDGIFEPTIENYHRITGENEHCVRLMTMAPEVHGAMELANRLKDKIALSAGHTDATCEQMLEAINWGFNQVTHLFNGMNPLQHREPGVPGAALSCEGLFVQIIADTIHLHPQILKFVAHAKGCHKCILITDSMEATGIGDGEFGLGTGKVFVKDGIARLAAGNLAGSTLTMDRALANMIEKVGIPPEEAIPMATSTPAAAIGEKLRGHIEEGMIADLVLMANDWSVSSTFVGGKRVYKAKT